MKTTPFPYRPDELALDDVSTPPPARVPRLWPGSTIVLLGGGPSLTAEDVARVGDARGEAMLPGATGPAVRVIAIKESYLLAPWADVLYACDDSWWKYYAGAPTFRGLKYALEPSPFDVAPQTWPGVTRLRNGGDSGIELDPSALRTGYNSGYQALNLAVHLGAVRILLLGFDCWGGPDGQQNWHVTERPHRDSPYPVFLQAFASLTEPLKALGVEVINCSRFTMIRAFPQKPLDEVLA